MQANISIPLLQRRSRARLGIGRRDLVARTPRAQREQMLLEQTSARIPEARWPRPVRCCQASLGRQEARSRCHRVALVGLRGAGKSSIGRRLADRLGLPFVELDREVEREGPDGPPDVFALQGQGVPSAGARRPASAWSGTTRRP
jgi:XRE family aerobic/anaerobic benzoate catabolism transcriptional regulator